MFFSIVRLAGESAVRPNTLFLNHLKWITGKKQVEKHFGRFGKITDVNIVFVSYFYLFDYSFLFLGLEYWSSQGIRICYF